MNTGAHRLFARSLSLSCPSSPMALDLLCALTCPLTPPCAVSLLALGTKRDARLPGLTFRYPPFLGQCARMPSSATVATRGALWPCVATRCAPLAGN